MQIVIDIPEVFYESLREADMILSGQRSGKTFISVIYSAVANGTPLPKGHGRLIDDDALKWVFEKNDKLNGFVQNLIARTPTVVEADRSE